jgi:hypothetical protein
MGDETPDFLVILRADYAGELIKQALNGHARPPLIRESLKNYSLFRRRTGVLK